jgi:uncharacterized protein YbjT (DUF2867 family)
VHGADGVVHRLRPSCGQGRTGGIAPGCGLRVQTARSASSAKDLHRPRSSPAEDAVKAAGIDSTILRCDGFATNTLAWAATVRAGSVVRAPYGQAATALIAEQDIAAAATRVLLDAGHAGQTYYLTGQQSLTQIQQAEAIGSAIGRPVRFEELPPEAFRQFATQRFPAPVVDDLLRRWAQSVGRAADIAPDLEKLTGRPATTYAQWAAQHADAYR